MYIILYIYIYDVTSPVIKTTAFGIVFLHRVWLERVDAVPRLRTPNFRGVRASLHFLQIEDPLLDGLRRLASWPSTVGGEQPADLDFDPAGGGGEVPGAQEAAGGSG